MANILLFHHAQGLTEGMIAFTNALRAEGHQVTMPDLYDGHTFSTLDEGLTYAKSVGFGALASAGVAAAESLPNEIVYGGFSLGVMPAQQLAQQRPGARGLLLYHGAAPLTEFGESWPEGVAFQAHVKQGDELGDVDVLEDLANQSNGELFIYEGGTHLFTDSSLDVYDQEATKQVVARTLTFLSALT